MDPFFGTALGISSLVGAGTGVAGLFGGGGGAAMPMANPWQTALSAALQIPGIISSMQDQKAAKQLRKDYMEKMNPANFYTSGWDYPKGQAPATGPSWVDTGWADVLSGYGVSKDESYRNVTASYNQSPKAK